jgi:tRNA A37 threonylcarbamoyladenosine modification protein TsaB
MRILAIDTALGACSACVLEAGEAEPLAREQLAMERGHAEALMPLVERVMDAVEGGFSSLTRVAVTVAPSPSRPASRRSASPRSQPAPHR